MQGEIEVQEQGLSLNDLEVGTLCQVAKVSPCCRGGEGSSCVRTPLAVSAELVADLYSHRAWPPRGLACGHTQEKLKFTIGYHEVEGSLTKLKKPVAILKRNFAAPDASVSGAEQVRG